MVTPIKGIAAAIAGKIGNFPDPLLRTDTTFNRAPNIYKSIIPSQNEGVDTLKNENTLANLSISLFGYKADNIPIGIAVTIIIIIEIKDIFIVIGNLDINSSQTGFLL